MNKMIYLTDELTSPLTRIMSVYDIGNLPKRVFDNNICAFHIGNGYIISVGHNIYNPNLFLRSVSETIYQNEIVSKLSKDELTILNSKYILDSQQGKRYLAANDNDIQIINSIFKRINFNLTYSNLYQKEICSPYLIYNFKENNFFESQYNTFFDKSTNFYESDIKRYTFVLELDLLETSFEYDFAIYRLKEKYSPLGKIIPKIDVDYSILNYGDIDLFCLQVAPINNLGRILNRAYIEGYLDQFSPLSNDATNPFFLEGLRYLIKGYFRFGSSGAPYVFYDKQKNNYVVNAIQSEACPLQLLINNNREGNQQYVNAIASPIINIKNIIEKYI